MDERVEERAREDDGGMARRLSRAAGVTALPFGWRVVDRPAYANQIATLTLDGDRSRVRIEAVVDDNWQHPELRTVVERDLT